MKITLSKIALALGFIASASVLNVAQAANLVAINSGTQIGVFDSANAAAAGFVNISGLSAGETLIGIDLRPSNNTIYGISSANRVYTVDAYSGAATFVSTLNMSIINTGLGYGFDFNPAADFANATSLRLVSSAGNNYAINVNTGAVAFSGTIPSGFSAVAYTDSNPAGAPTTTPTLYYVSSSADTLNVNTNPGGFNAPNIQPVGTGLGIDILNANGLEILPDGTAYLAANFDNGTSQTVLYSINLLTGKATLSGSSLFSSTFDGTINGLSAAPSAVPVPAAAWLFGSALLGLVGFRRKSV